MQTAGMHNQVRLWASQGHLHRLLVRLHDEGFAIYLTAEKFLRGVIIGNRPLLLLAVLLIFIGFQFITMGLLGEMLARTYHESQNRPIFVVGEILEERKSA